MLSEIARAQQRRLIAPLLACDEAGGDVKALFERHLVLRRQLLDIGETGHAKAEQARWSVTIAPDQQPDHWLPTGKVSHFELTLRAYLPDDGGKGNFTADQLPTITREDCA